MRTRLLALLTLLALPVAGATPPPPNDVLARVGNETITVADFNRFMEQRGGRVPGTFATPEQRMALLEEMVRFRAVVAAARRDGLDRDPQVVAAFERMLADKYLRAKLEERLAKVKVEDKEIEAFYAQHRAEYVTPERVRAALLVVLKPKKASPETLAQLRKKAEEGRAKALQLGAGTNGFGSLAINYSDDPGTRYIGGEIGWVYPAMVDSYKWEKPALNAIFALHKDGDVSPLVEGEQAFYVARLVTRETQQPVPLDKLRAGFVNRLLKEKRQQVEDEFYKELTAGTSVDIDRDKVAHIAPLTPAEPRTPPPLPGGGAVAPAATPSLPSNQ